MKNNQVVIFDTTLRDGEQSAGASMTVEDKIAIAEILDSMNVDIIAIPRRIFELAKATNASPRVASTAVTSMMPTLAADSAFRKGRNRSGYFAGLMRDRILGPSGPFSLWT